MAKTTRGTGRPRRAAAGRSDGKPATSQPSPSLAHIARLADLTPDPRNANEGTERGVGMLESSMRKYGAGRSILVDKHGVIIAGNKTHERAVDIGLEGAIIVPTDGTRLVVVQRTDLDLSTDPAAVELGIADNRIGEVGLAWNAAVLAELVAAGANIESLWSEKELVQFMASRGPKDGLTDPDDVPAERATDIKAGDLFELGSHRLLCGDCTKAEDVARLMGREKAGLVFTDPPYGMGYDPAMCDTVRPKGEWCNKPKNYRKVVGDDAPFDPASILDLFVRCHEIFLWGADYYSDRITRRDAGSWFVWDKRAGLEDVKWTTSEFELCWSKARHQRQFIRVRWHGLCGMENDDTKARVHPTQKPAELARWFLDRFSATDALVVDGYAGSGFTLIASEQLNRRCRAVEIEPSYCQVIIDRWQAFTGKTVAKVGEAIRA